MKSTNITRQAPVGIGSGLPAPARKAFPEVAGRHLVVGRAARLGLRRGGARPARAVCAADLAGVASTVPAIATSMVVVWGAIMLSRDATHAGQGGKICPACGGTGLESCFCNRWSDGDAGCRTCNHTGYMKCRSCGGGGTAVPIALSVRKGNSAGRPL